MTKSASSLKAIRWTNPSVRDLAEDGDPVQSILARVREGAFSAMESGWSGPPYDPIELAERSGVEVIPIEEVEDARLVHHGRKPRIEFNPNRSPERVRFSIAHELGHLAFPDAAEKIRNRAHSTEAQGDDWQVELLCNLAAAEILMPTGSFPELADGVSLEHLIYLSTEFFVPVEAAVLRAVRLASEPACVFAAARSSDGRRFRLDYLSGSRSWNLPLQVKTITEAAALTRCTAVGSTAKEDVGQPAAPLRLECVGVPPYPGSRFPRILGLLRSLGPQPDAPRIEYLQGNAVNPPGHGPKLIAHVVNDKTPTWGGNGFAPQLRDAYPDLQEAFSAWALEPGNLELGHIHICDVGAGVRIATMVAQHGYGIRAARIPLRYNALEECLRRLRIHLEAGEPSSVHMPQIGAGQAGGEWRVIAEMVSELLLDVSTSLTVYLLPGTQVPQPGPQQLGLQF